MPMDNIKDIKPPVYFPSNYLPFIIIVVLCVLAASVFLVNRLIRKKFLNKMTPVRKKTAYETACEALDALKAKDLIRSGKIKEYYIELSFIVRQYLENKFNIRAPEMTTEEFLEAAKRSDALSMSHKELLKTFLSHADMVKFAKYGPNTKETEESFLAVKRLIDETNIAEEVSPVRSKTPEAIAALLVRTSNGVREEPAK